MLLAEAGHTFLVTPEETWQGSKFPSWPAWRALAAVPSLAPSDSLVVWLQEVSNVSLCAMLRALWAPCGSLQARTLSKYLYPEKFKSGVVTRYVGSEVKGVGSGIRRVRSGITALESGIRSHGIGISSFFEGSVIKLYHFCGIRDQKFVTLLEQGSEIWVQKWDQRWKNIPRYNPVKFVSNVRDFDHRNFDGISITAEFSIFVSF